MIAMDVPCQQILFYRRLDTDDREQIESWSLACLLDGKFNGCLQVEQIIGGVLTSDGAVELVEKIALASAWIHDNARAEFHTVLAANNQRGTESVP